MTLKTKLASLVMHYARFDAEKKIYVSNLDKERLLKLDADFTKLINQLLLVDGPDSEKILRQYRKLSLYVHPDKRANYQPEVVWLEENLSLGEHNGTCFKTLFSCYEKLTKPQKFKEPKFSDIKSNADCRKWLEHLRNNAQTYTKRCLCESLMDLLDQSGHFFDDMNKIKPSGLKMILTSLPIIFSSYSAALFSEELFAVYAIFYLTLKGGQRLERSDYLEIQKIGRTLQDLTCISATATTVLLVRLLEMTFWVSHQCYDVSMHIGVSLFKPLLAPFQENPKQKEHSSLCQDLILASTIPTEGLRFKTRELKVIAVPLENYLNLNKAQLLGNWRAGKDKRLAIEAFLFQMQVLDVGDEPLEEKLSQADKELKKIRGVKEVYSQKTAHAVDTAQRAIALLRQTYDKKASVSSDEMQVILYETPKCVF